jgi:hypothetical protein
MTLLKGGRPVVYLSIMLNYQLSGVNVVSYHIFNVANHILNSVLVYYLVLGTLMLPQFLDRYQAKAQRMALFCALLFGVHPIQTESVTYIISRTELLATLFYLTSLLLFIRAVKTKNFIYYVLAGLSVLLSINSKEWAITIPAIALLYDYFFLTEGKIKTVLSHWAGYILISIPCIYFVSQLNLFSQTTAGVGFNIASTTGINAKTYLLTSFNVTWTYIRLLFLPINQNLDYDYAIAKTLFEFPTALSFLGHLAVVAAAVWVYWKKGWTLIPFGIAWFYITLSPTQSFVPIVDVIFEHRVYMPCIGFFVAFIVAYEMFFDWLGEKRAGAAQAGLS